MAAVEHLAADVVRDLTERVARARRAASEQMPERREQADDAAYWECVFEINAAAVLRGLARMQLATGHAVRYRFYGRRGNDFLVRPFVARAGTDVSSIRRLLDWHPPPDAARSGDAGAGRDVELLYRHFTFEPSAAGVFEYWVAMQELWASQRWIHSTVIADAEHFSQLTASPEWEVERPVERVEPAVIRDGDGSQIAVLVHCPIERHLVMFHRVRIAADYAVSYAESIVVAHGPRGYLT
jgi:hypothetical protein